MDNIASFSSRLKSLRLENRLLQKELAKKLNMAQTTIANYEQGNRFPDEKTLHKIADYFNVSTDYLLGRIEANAFNENYKHDSVQLSASIIEPSVLALKNAFLNALISGKLNIASQMIQNAVNNKMIDVKHLYVEIFERSLVEIGQLWDMNVIDTYQEHFFSYATQLIMSQLYSHIQTNKKIGRSLVAMSAYGEPHIIGIRMVNDFFEMEGWNTCFLGSDVPAQSLLKALKERKADMLAISCTMPYCLDSITSMIKAVKSVKELRNVKIIVGGRVFNHDQKLWKLIQADGYCRNAYEAAEFACSLVSKSIVK